MHEEVRNAFLHRPRLVEKAPGFCGLEVLTDAGDASVFLLVTRWENEESFRAWHASDAHHQSHQFIPHGLKLDPSFTSLTVGNRIENPGGVENLSDAIEGQTVALSEWLTESDEVFTLLLAKDGTIRSRNRLGHRVFPTHPGKDSIWDYLVCSDAEHLRQRLAHTGEPPPDSHLLLNLADGERNPITLEVALIRCTGAFLLLGTTEHRHDSNVQTQLLQLTNDLSVMMREAAQKNRELQRANEMIDRLARTDSLTGLANRRTLQEALQREIARAERMKERLSVIMGDLDHFKSINDQYGHLTGDQVLARAAAVFMSQSRPYDLAARYGGEEFILLLPGLTTEAAVAVAERLRKAVAEMSVPGCPRQITVSLGVATWISGELSEEFVSRADAALYNAKNAGRNRVEAAPEGRGK